MENCAHLYCLNRWELKSVLCKFAFPAKGEEISVEEVVIMMSIMSSLHHQESMWLYFFPLMWCSTL